MLNKQILDKLKKYFQSQKNILAVYLYGSFANGRPNKMSDIDFGIVLNGSVSDSMVFDLQLKFMGEFDALLRKDLNYQYVDAVILNIVSPLLKQQAIINGKLIYCSNQNRCVEFEVQTLKEYDDTMHLRETYYYYLNKQANSGILGEKYVFKR